MTELKTKANNESVTEFLDSIQNQTRKQDAFALLEIYKEVTGCAPKMWGSSIIGFGTYYYTNAKGEKVQWMRSAFSPRKQYLSLYLLRGVEKNPKLLDQLGKYKNGQSCLTINKLANVDITVLQQLIQADLNAMNETYNSN